MQSPVCEERFGSPVIDYGGGGSSARKLYQAQWYEGELDALAAIITESPAVYEGLYRQRISSLQEIAPFIWTAEVEYGERSGEVGTWERTFDTTGGTAHVTQSFGTRGSVGTGLTAPPDFGGAIGVTENGVEGCDIVVPRLQFTITYNFPIAFVTRTYEALCASLTGKVNGSSWGGYAARTLLYLGATGRFQGQIGSPSVARAVSVMHTFAASPNVMVPVGGKTLQKYGWDYFWTWQKKKIDTNAKAKVWYPGAAYSSIVYEEAEFSALGMAI